MRYSASDQAAMLLNFGDTALIDGQHTINVLLLGEAEHIEVDSSLEVVDPHLYCSWEDKERYDLKAGRLIELYERGEYFGLRVALSVERDQAGWAVIRLGMTDAG